jgi:hypothetical protein
MANRRCITQGARERVTVRDGKLLPMGPSLPVGFAPIVDQTGLRSGLFPLAERVLPTFFLWIFSTPVHNESETASKHSVRSFRFQFNSVK